MNRIHWPADVQPATSYRPWTGWAMLVLGFIMVTALLHLIGRLL